MHPTNRKVYLILFNIDFNGIFKSQGEKVKLMVCDKTQRKMHKNAWKQTFSKMQNQQLFNERLLSFFSNLLRFHAVNKENFRSDQRATYTRHEMQKLMQKDFFPSY
jgi:hypothetical protein